MSNGANHPVIEAVGLSKVFTDFWGRPKAAAVNRIDFQVRQGEVVGFLGPNGSGKSTTIKMILGLLYPSSGSLTVFGRKPTHVGIKQKIGYLPEETYLYRYLTAAETLDFFGALFNLPQNERAKRSKQLLEMVGLAHAADRPVGEFSKGMARRIGLAQALINDPDLVILDEPTSGLDPIGCRKVKEIIRLLASRKKTVILCSHLLADVQDVCDNVLIMYGGHIRARGTMAELLTVEDKTRIVAPSLPPDVLERVMAMIGECAAVHDVAVDHPSLNLEDYFLEVVRQARAESQETSGTAGEGAIAGYLRGQPESVEEKLQRLTAPEPPPAKAVEAPAKPPKPAADMDRLAALTESAPEPAPKAEAQPAAAPADKAEASRKIEDLLKKKQ